MTDLSHLIDNLQGKNFNKVLKSEVDKANKRLKRMNDFQKRLFENKGITHISRKGSFEDKINALAMAKTVNDSGISTKTEYKKYSKKLQRDLSLNEKAVDYMLKNIDFETEDFIRNSKLKLDSNPQVDFLFEDVMEVSDNIDDRLDSIADFITNNFDLTNEIISYMI